MDGSPYSGWLARCRFPNPPASVVCAVSGGADSSALAILAVATGLTVRIMHVDHGLRSTVEAAAEAAAVGDLGARLGVPVEVVTVTVSADRNVEARARAARYAALPAGALTGHTLDDQLETVLLQLCRGGGVDALAGIRPEGRPILQLRREETEAVCALFGHVPVVDPSNALSVHRRNRVRAEVVPLLNQIFERDVAPVVARASGIVAQERDLLDRLASEIDVTDVPRAKSTELPLLRRAVRHWLHDGHPPDAAAVDRVIEVILGDRRATEVEGGRRVGRSAGRLYLEHTDGGG